jgi:hypothetical protein
MSLPSSVGRFADLRVQDHADRPGVVVHRKVERVVTNQRTHDVAMPAALAVTVRGATAQADARAIDGFLTKRAESFALDADVAVFDVALEVNCFKRLSSARISTMPRIISSFSSTVRDAAIASRAMNPSTASSSSVTADFQRSSASDAWCRFGAVRQRRPFSARAGWRFGRSRGELSSGAEQVRQRTEIVRGQTREPRGDRRWRRVTSRSRHHLNGTLRDR